jgi:hypothetical protein
VEDLPVQQLVPELTSLTPSAFDGLGDLLPLPEQHVGLAHAAWR